MVRVFLMDAEYTQECVWELFCTPSSSVTLTTLYKKGVEVYRRPTVTPASVSKSRPATFTK